MEDLNLQVESLFSLDAEALQTQLLARFYAWRDSRPAANIYVLLDQSHPVAGHDDLHRTQLLKRKVSRHVEPVSRPDLQGDPDTAPLLVQLYVAGEHGYADESLIELTLRHSLKRCRSVNGAYVAGWICSDAHPKPLADWIAKSGVVFVQHEGRQRFMPFFEPFRMALLADDETSSPFLTRWLGPSVNGCYWTAQVLYARSHHGLPPRPASFKLWGTSTSRLSHALALPDLSSWPWKSLVCLSHRNQKVASTQ